MKIYHIGQYDSIIESQFYSDWVSRNDYAIQLDKGENVFIKTYYYPYHEYNNKGEQLNLENIPENATEINVSDMDKFSRRYLSTLISVPILTEEERDEIEYQKSCVKTTVGNEIIGKFYVRKQVEFMLDNCFPGEPIEGNFSEDDYFIQTDVDLLTFPGTKKSLYSNISYYYSSVGINVGLHFKVDVLLTPWELTEWKSKSVYEDWLKIEEEKKKLREKNFLEKVIENQSKNRDEEKYNYAFKCGKISHMYNVPFEVVLTLTPKAKYKALKSRIQSYKNWLYANESVEELYSKEVVPGVIVYLWIPSAPPLKEILHELSCETKRRNYMIKEILGIKVPRGSINSSRIATWLSKELQK